VALVIAVAMLGDVTFAGATDAGNTFFASAKGGKIDPESIRVDDAPKCVGGATLVSWEEGGSPGSLDALGGSPCRVGTPAAGLVISYARSGAVTLMCDSTNQPTLTVSTGGEGFGFVTSAPAGIACGQTNAATTSTDCMATYPYATEVVLTATPSASPYSAFTGWSGACSNTTGTCTITMTEARAVTATFAGAGTAPGADPSTCDPGTFVGSPTAAQLAAALGLCAASDGSAGVVAATIAQGDGTTLSPCNHTAAGLAGAGPSVTPPSLIAGESDPGCPQSSNVYDDPTLTLTLRAPTNATAFSFQYSFFGSAYPECVCSVYSDKLLRDHGSDSVGIDRWEHRVRLLLEAGHRFVHLERALQRLSVWHGHACQHRLRDRRRHGLAHRCSADRGWSRVHPRLPDLGLRRSVRRQPRPARQLPVDDHVTRSSHSDQPTSKGTTP
jgi:hypothetical protein